MEGVVMAGGIAVFSGISAEISRFRTRCGRNEALGALRRRLGNGAWWRASGERA